MLPLRLFTILLILTAAGCATQTPYEPARKADAAGYYETRLTDDRYRITFTGNTATPSETVRDYAMLRAAELTLSRGYDWFQLADRHEDKKVRDNSTAGTDVIFPPQTTVVQRCGVVGCDATVVSSSPGVGVGAGVSGPPSTAYSSSLEIVMGRNPIPKGTNSYDARQLAETLRQRVKESG